MSKEMLINTVEGHECRIAVIVDGVLDELYVERASSASRVGNIYKGRVSNVEPAIQAAFVDFGAGKNGFLHISDVNPQYFPRGQKGGAETVGRKRSHRDRPPIQECLRRGQEVVVQMTKEGIGTKGPTLTTYLSIPGRLLVMMPGMSRLGVSRKVQDEETRAQAKAILQDLKLPPEMGFILRTAGLDRPKREIQRDLNYLTRLWQAISRRIKAVKAPSEIYQESDLVIRTIRDVYNTDIERIICDRESVARHVKEFLDMAMPRAKHKIELYAGKEGLFHEFQLEAEMERIFARRVELKSGGWLALDQAEALVAIDVNSGRFREHSDAESTATNINLEAAKEIARQLRLRDLGGVIIIDFIDMREERNRRAVERALRDAVKDDRAKTKILRVSAFGIVEMTRQRVRPSLRDSIYHRCLHCDGTGLIKSEESQALSVMRSLQRACSIQEIVKIDVTVTPPVASQVSNYHRNQLVDLEAASGIRILVAADSALRSDEFRFNCTNNRGSPVAWDALIAAAARKPLETVDVETLPGITPPPEFDELPDFEEGATGGEAVTMKSVSDEMASQEEEHFEDTVEEIDFGDAEYLGERRMEGAEEGPAEEAETVEPAAASAGGPPAPAHPRPQPPQRQAPPPQPQRQQRPPQGQRPPAQQQGQRPQQPQRQQPQRQGQRPPQGQQQGQRPPGAQPQGQRPQQAQPPRQGQRPAQPQQQGQRPPQGQAQQPPRPPQHEQEIELHGPVQPGQELGFGRRRRRGRRGGQRHRRRMERLQGHGGLPQDQGGQPQGQRGQPPHEQAPSHAQPPHPAAQGQQLSPAEGAKRQDVTPSQPAGQQVPTGPAQQQQQVPAPAQPAGKASRVEPWEKLIGVERIETAAPQAAEAKPEVAKTSATAEPAAPQAKPKKARKPSTPRMKKPKAAAGAADDGKAKAAEAPATPKSAAKKPKPRTPRGGKGRGKSAGAGGTPSE